MYKQILTSLGVLVIGAGLPVAAVGLVNAQTSTSKIPLSVLRAERLDAQASVLNTSSSNVQAARKDKTLSTLITNDGLTKATFHQKVTAELTAELEAKGYGQTDITAALKHAPHHHGHMKSTSKRA